MKTKQLAIMVAVAAVLGGAAFFLNKKDGTSPGSAGGAGAKVIDLPVNDVAGIAIQSATGKLSLVKKDDAWTVEDRAGYPADFTRVHGLLTKLWDLKTVQEVKAGASQYARLELAEPLAGAGTKIEFKDKDGKALGALLLGKKHMKEGGGGAFGGMGGEGEFPAGRYVMQAGGSRVSLISETLDDVEAKPESWLARDFFKIENPSAVTLAGTTDAQNWKLTRENATAEWKLAGAKDTEKVDAGKASGLGFVFANPTFTDVMASDAKPADTGLDKPAVLTFETFDNFTYVLKVGKLTGENHPVTIEISAKLAKERTPGKDEKPEDKTRLDEEFKTKLKGLEEKLAAEKKVEGRVYLIAKANLDQAIKDRSALLPDKAPDPATSAAGTPVPAIPPGVPVPEIKPAPPAVVSPPVAVPPVPKPPANPTPAKPPQKPVSAPAPAPGTAPAKPERKPVTAVAPPVTVPPPAKTEPPKPATPAADPAKPAAPATPPSNPGAPAPPPPAPAPPAKARFATSPGKCSEAAGK